MAITEHAYFALSTAVQCLVLGMLTSLVVQHAQHLVPGTEQFERRTCARDFERCSSYFGLGMQRRRSRSLDRGYRP